MCFQLIEKMLQKHSLPEPLIRRMLQSAYSIELDRDEPLNIDMESTCFISVDEGLIGEFNEVNDERSICSGLFSAGTLVPYRTAAEYNAQDTLRFVALTNSRLMVLPNKSSLEDDHKRCIKSAQVNLNNYFIEYTRDLAFLRSAIKADEYIELFILIYFATGNYSLKKTSISISLLSQATGCTRQYANRVVANLEREQIVQKVGGKLMLIDKNSLLSKVDVDLLRKFYYPIFT